MTPYKVGDKVETPLGIGIIKTTGLDDEMYLKSEVELIKYPNEYLVFKDKDIKPYQSAHDKLYDVGFIRRTNTATRKVYRLFEVEIDFQKYEDGLWRYTLSDNFGVYKNFSNILTQYLEELEND